MKKAFQKWVCVFCAFALLLAGISGLRAAASVTTSTFHLRIEGANKTVLSKDCPTGETVDTALKSALGAKSIPYTISTGEYGDYITSIDNQAGDSNDYWSFYLNGAYSDVGISSATPANGDVVVIAFIDLNTLYPNVVTEPATPVAGQPFTFKVTAQKTTYDSNWNATTSTVVLSGATITFNGQSKTTGSDGSAAFTAPTSAGTYFYSINEDVAGQTMPALVRLTDIPFTITSSSGSSSSGSSSVSSSSSSGSSSSGGVAADVTGAIKGAAQILQNDSSDWGAFALTRAGYTAPSAYLPAAAEDIAQNLDNFRAITLAKYVLTLRAAGADPTSFNQVNLVNRLYQQTNVGLTGLNGYIFTLYALDSADYTPPANAAVNKTALVASILSAQNGNGGFALASGLPGDVDITAMALTALAPHVAETGVQTAVNKALSYLSNSQQANGGFVASGSTSEASESSAQVVIALSSLGIDPAADFRFVKSGHSPLSNLLSFAKQDGSFAHTAGGTGNTIATEQALEALTAYRLLKSGGTLYDLRGISATVRTVTPASDTDTTSSSSGDASQAANPDTGADMPYGASAAIVFAAVGILLLAIRRRKP